MFGGSHHRRSLPGVLFKACDRCGGDLSVWFDDDYLCVHCGKVFYDLPRLLMARQDRPQVA